MHVAAVYDGSTMELFLDGASVGSAAKSGSITPNAAVPVWIGANPTEPSDKPWKGKIDDVRIYDRALSPAELQALPPSSEMAIFADGFESGDTSAWSQLTMGSLQVLNSAARVGVRGLRAQAGTGCVAGDFVSIEPPPLTISGTREACRSLSAAGVEVVAPGGTLRAGEQIELGEGFRASADLVLEINPVLTPYAWVRDSSPAGEATYLAEFDVRLDALALGGSDRLEMLVARRNAGGEPFRLVIQSDGASGHEAFLEARLDNGTYVATVPGQEVAITNGWHRLRIEWRAGAGSGVLRLSVDGALATESMGLTNSAQRVDSVDWGVVSGSLDGASGSIDLDSFRSWR